MNRLLRKTLGDKIAAAIRAKDKTYFFENYSKQADAVIEAIDEAGFVLVRKEPSTEMLEAGATALQYGVQKKHETLRRIYAAMVRESLKHPD